LETRHIPRIEALTAVLSVLLPQHRSPGAVFVSAECLLALLRCQ